MGRRISLRVTLADVHKDSGFDQRNTHSLAIKAHPASDRPHRDARSRQAHSLRLLVEPQPRPVARYVAAAKVGEHCGAVDAVPLSKSLHTHPGQVVTDERVHLSGGEKSLSRLDSPHNRAAIVPRSSTLRPSRDRVDPTVQAVDQGFRLGGGVAKRTTQAPRTEAVLTRDYSESEPLLSSAGVVRTTSRRRAARAPHGRGHAMFLPSGLRGAR